MPKRPFALGMVLLLVLLPATPALARWGSSGGHSSSHSSSHKSKDGYMVRHCKTDACFKKHPSGTYGFVPGEHKK